MADPCYRLSGISTDWVDTVLAENPNLSAVLTSCGMWWLVNTEELVSFLLQVELCRNYVERLPKQTLNRRWLILINGPIHFQNFRKKQPHVSLCHHCRCHPSASEECCTMGHTVGHTVQRGSCDYIENKWHTTGRHSVTSSARFFAWYVWSMLTEPSTWAVPTCAL